VFVVIILFILAAPSLDGLLVVVVFFLIHTVHIHTTCRKLYRYRYLALNVVVDLEYDVEYR